MGWLHCARAQVSTQFLYLCGWRFSGWRFSGWRFEGGSRAVFDWRSAGGFRLAVCVWRFAFGGLLRAFCGRFAGGLPAVCGRPAFGGLRAVCEQFAAGLWTVCGQHAGGLWLAVCGRFASGMQAVCGRFASGLRRVSVAAGFVCRFAFGGLCLSVCVLRFAFCALRLTVCAWRFALGGLHLAVRGRIAGGFADGLRADCWRFRGRFTVGSLRAVCERQAGGCRPICGWWFAATIN